MKFKIALIVSQYIGLTALIGGWCIFISWTIGRYLFAVDLDFLEEVGFYWILIFFWLALLAIILLFIYAIANYKRPQRKTWITAFLILLNIPSVLLIISLQADIEKRTFVKIKNESGNNNLDLNLHSTFFTKKIGEINNGKSKVINYEVPYVFCERAYSKKDSLFLSIDHNGKVDTIDFPTLYMTECYDIKIDSQLNLQHRNIPYKEFYF